MTTMQERVARLSEIVKSGEDGLSWDMTIAAMFTTADERAACDYGPAFRLATEDLRALLTFHTEVTEALEGVRGVSEKATAGPWDVFNGKGRLHHVDVALDAPKDAGAHICSMPMRDEANADFVALGSNTIRRLLALTGEG